MCRILLAEWHTVKTQIYTVYPSLSVPIIRIISSFFELLSIYAVTGMDTLQERQLCQNDFAPTSEKAPTPFSAVDRA